MSASVVEPSLVPQESSVGVPKATATQHVAAPHPLRILAVDDSALVRRRVGRLLENAGHTLSFAESGEEAFSRAMGECFDAIITDISMGAVSGVHLCRMLRSERITRDIPILLLTADDGARSRFWGRHAGADAHLAKDQLDDLVDVVGRIATGPRAAPTTTMGSVDPIAHLCRVLDQELHHAVILSEGRALLEHLDDPHLFAEACTHLLRDVVECPYAALVFDDEGVDRSIVLARGALPESWSSDGIPFLALPSAPFAVTQTEGDRALSPHELNADHLHRQPITAGRKLVGELRLHGGTHPIAHRDIETVAWLAEALAGPVASLRLVQRIQRIATTDGLTGLLNRRTIEDRLREEVDRSKRYGTPLGIVLCDIDHFKKVNDTFGHAMGDEVLRSVAIALRDVLRSVDAVGRWGGEEFLLVLPHQVAGGACVAAERVRRAVTSLPAFPKGPECVTLSLGVTVYDGRTDAASLVERADRALYDAKSLGRNRVELYTGIR